ncbi:MAG: right-handed parallel beta-helix repeat-containing protein [Proteobacteria bacterium]|nr:right-handed parallel beta-helix repeat-containing protein [Pseudomonadota bacterium]
MQFFHFSKKFSLIATLILFNFFAQADEALDNKVKEIFQEKCSECHSPNGRKNKKPELHKSINLEALRANADYVNAGDPNKSVIHQRITLADDDSDLMPQSNGAKGDKEFRERLSPEEVNTIKDWITGATKINSTSNSNNSREFYSDTEIISVALKDLKNLDPKTQKSTRYLSLSSLYNRKDANGNPLLSDNTLKIAKQAVDKLLNSMSIMNPDIALSTAVDDKKILLRINLKNYSWFNSDWKQIESFYPYGLNQDNIDENTLKELTQTELPILRADWFIFAVSQAPLYHSILRIPQKLADSTIERQLGINVDDNIRQGRALRLGFKDSGVSTGNRMLERHEVPGNSYYWKSYDFDELKHSEEGHDIFTSPLGPESVGISFDRVFKHDGGEMIWKLPNGMQAYLLTNDKGDRLNIGPSNIVRDTTHPKGLIVNGISCISCHNAGMKTPKPGPFDQIAPIVETLNFGNLDAQLVKNLFAKDTEAKIALDKDSKSFANALQKMGIDPNSEIEPVRAIYDLFLAPISVGTLQSELGVGGNNFIDKLSKSSDDETRILALSLIKGSNLDRKFFADKFKKIASKLNLNPSEKTPRLPVEFGGKEIAEDENTKTLIIKTPSTAYPTIQSAINFARNGDKVLIEPGRYEESLYINRAIRLEGKITNSNNEVQIVPPEGSSAAIIIDGAGAEISKLSITSTGADRAKAHPVRGIDLGVKFIDNGSHLEVSAIEAGGIAENNGIKIGDQLIRVDGQNIRFQDESFHRVAQHKVDDISLYEFKRADNSLIRLSIQVSLSKDIGTVDGIVLINSPAKLSNITISNIPGIALTSFGENVKNKWTANDLNIFSNHAAIEHRSGFAELKKLSIAENSLSGLFVVTGAEGSISESSIFRNKHHGIRLQKSGNFLIENSKISENSQNGIFIKEGSELIKINDTVSYDNENDGIQIEKNTNVILRNSIFQNNKRNGFVYSTLAKIDAKECSSIGNKGLGFGELDGENPTQFIPAAEENKNKSFNNGSVNF